MIRETPRGDGELQSLRYLFIFESDGWYQELLDATDDEEESVLYTFSFTEIRAWDAGADGTPSGMSGISKDTADKRGKIL